MAHPTDITGQIAEFAIETGGNKLPASARDVLRLSLADWVAVALAGGDEPVARIVREVEAEAGGAGEAFVIGLDRALPARAAALVNGAAGHALDYDDTHFASLGHPSVAVIPAALAIADKTGADGQAFQEAALIGMEAAVRIGMWLGRTHYRTGFHMTGTAGTFGAALAASRLLGLTTEQARHALGIAASRAGGVKAQFGTMGKPLHAGFAASGGVEAALLAARGFISTTHGLEGAQGFGKTHHGEENDGALDGLGEDFIFEKISHKFHACCHGTHAALEALLAIRTEHGVKPDDIDYAEITVHPQYLDICNLEAPRTGLEAKFSYRLVTALMMHDYDTARLQTFNDAVCTDPDLVALRDRVRVMTEPAMAETAATVRIGLRGGDTLSEAHDLLDQRDISVREAKIKAKLESLLGPEKAGSLWQDVAINARLPSEWVREGRA